MAEIGDPLGGIDVFEDLAPRDRDAIAKACRWRRYDPHQLIVGHQEPATEIFFIATGRVRVTMHSATGKEVAFRDLGAGQSFGELAAIDGEPRSASVVALSETLIAAMSAEIFAGVLRDHPEVSARVLALLAGYVRQLSERVFEFSTLAVRNRIHAELLRLAREYGVTDGTATIRPSPTHADIAARISTHREAVTRELNALTQAGLIARRDGALVIADVAQLERMVEEVTGE